MNLNNELRNIIRGCQAIEEDKELPKEVKEELLGILQLISLLYFSLRKALPEKEIILVSIPKEERGLLDPFGIGIGIVHPKKEITSVLNVFSMYSASFKSRPINSKIIERRIRSILKKDETPR